MYLKRLLLTDFKNCPSADILLSEKVNCFVGQNGAGKTNLLDAVYYLSFCKSYFNPADIQNIRHDQPLFVVHGDYDTGTESDNRVSCIQRRGQKKKFQYNRKDYDRLADHIGRFPLVMISPADRDLINEGSEVRRKYIDSVISQFDKTYLDHLIQYNRALAQRNTLLRSFAEKNYFDAVALELWDEQLVHYGVLIKAVRQSFVDEFIPVFNEIYSFISNDAEEVGVEYVSQLHRHDLKALLAETLPKDCALRYTTAGVHKDDLRLTLGGYPVKKFGSQGQQKSFVVAIKLAQFEYTCQKKGYKPILLLDDIFDKLDARRVEQLITLVGDNRFGQVFITDTQYERIADIFHRVPIHHHIFNVENGVVTPRSDYEKA